MRISIRNSFIHVMLFCYFKHAYYIYCGNMCTKLSELSYSDLSSQKDVFSRIYSKIKGIGAEPSFLNELFILLHLKQCYPIHISFTPEEKFWFEYIIHINVNQIKLNTENFNKQRSISRFMGNLQDTFSEEIITRLYTIEATEYLRKKFIMTERIQNSPTNQLSHRV